MIGHNLPVFRQLRKGHNKFIVPTFTHRIHIQTSHPVEVKINTVRPRKSEGLMCSGTMVLDGGPTRMFHLLKPKGVHVKAIVYFC